LASSRLEVASSIDLLGFVNLQPDRPVCRAALSTWVFDGHDSPTGKESTATVATGVDQETKNFFLLGQRHVSLSLVAAHAGE
jgi:hypothetical protein